MNEGIPVKKKGFLSALYKRNQKAGMTIEAALAFPLFLFFVIAVSYFLILISLQSDIQLSMEETARSIGKTAYLATHTADISGGGTGADTEGLLSAGINALTIKSWMLKDGLGEKINRSKIKGGIGGFYVYHSGYDMKQGILDIIVNYTYEIPFFPAGLKDIRFVQRCRSHVWIGKLLKESSGSDSEGTYGEKEGTTVYVTPYGTAYHLSKDCHYLDLSIQGVAGNSIDGLRNHDGGKYYMCTDCCKKGESYGTVYITDYGTNWHADLHCTGLKRTIEEIDLAEAGERHVCPMCGGGR